MTLAQWSRQESTRLWPRCEVEHDHGAWLGMPPLPSGPRSVLTKLASTAQAPTAEETAPDDHPTRPDSVCGVVRSSVTRIYLRFPTFRSCLLVHQGQRTRARCRPLQSKCCLFLVGLFWVAERSRKEKVSTGTTKHNETQIDETRP